MYELLWDNIDLSVWRSEEKKNLSSYADVVHTTANQVISRRGKNENGSEMYTNKILVQSVQNYSVSFLNMQTGDVVG